MKQIISITLLACISAAVVGCDETTENKIENTTDSLAAKVESGVENLGNKVDSMVNKDADQEFLSDAVEANTMELKTLMIGREKGSKDVKSHASQMIADHKKLGADVMAYVKKKNITLTDVDTAGLDNDLGDKPAGKDFDKAFADRMVNDHEKVIDMFEDAQDDVKDPALKQLIGGALPKLKSHLEMSKQMQQKLNGNNANTR